MKPTLPLKKQDVQAKYSQRRNVASFWKPHHRPVLKTLSFIFRPKGRALHWFSICSARIYLWREDRGEECAVAIHRHPYLTLGVQVLLS